VAASDEQRAILQESVTRTENIIASNTLTTRVTGGSRGRWWRRGKLSWRRRIPEHGFCRERFPGQDLWGAIRGGRGEQNRMSCPDRPVSRASPLTNGARARGARSDRLPQR
jgi:hypothetical protein